MPEQEELPQEVAQAAQQEFGQQPEASRKTWNKRFNGLANKLQQVIDESDQFHVAFRQKLPYKDDENVAVGMGKGYIKGIAGAAHIISTMEFGVLKSLAELGAKATGGRVLKTEAPKSK